MKFRISSWFIPTIVLFATVTVAHSTVIAEDQPGYYTDPATGIVYRKVVRTVERPVYETKTEKKETTVFRPETVTETVPAKSTVFVPQTNYTWQPVLHNRWNPFRQPSITYHHVPTTQWRQQDSATTQTRTLTKWIPEKKMVDVPTAVVKMKREEQIDFQIVGRVAPLPTPASSVPPAIASRLRPLTSDARIQPLGTNPRPYGQQPQLAQGSTQGWTARGTAAGGAVNRGPSTAPFVANGTGYGTSFGNTPYGASGSGSRNGTQNIAASTVGRLTSDPPRRTISQGGIRPTDLYPSAPTGHSQALPPASGGTGIANMPGWSLWR